MHGVKYEYGKRILWSHLPKHGIWFSDAVRVFDKYDKDHSDEEDRWKVIGMVDNIIVVIYTDREDRTRIISARRAKKDERRDYYGHRES